MISDKKNIFFSIIIPTYNRANLIGLTIDSILNQTYTNYEIIIVDDGSTDNTEEVIKKINHQKISYLKKENAERGAARNFGMAHANGEYITFVDSDDLLYPDYFLNAFKYICEFSFPPFFHLGYEVRSANGKIIFKADNVPSDETNFLVKGNLLSCMGIFINKNIANEFKFNEDRELAGSEDWELWMRITAKYGIKASNTISACIVDHTNRSVSNFEEKKLVRRKRLSLDYAFKNNLVNAKFQNKFKAIEASSDLYIALHLILSTNYKRGLFYFKRALLSNPLLIFDKRALACFKRILLKTN